MTNLIPTAKNLLPANVLRRNVQEALKPIIKSNPYTALITRTSPTAFVFLIDQSGSMGEQITYDGENCTKAEAVARVVNQTVYELVNRCVKGNEVRRYYDIALVGYGDNDTANLLWEGNLTGRTWVSPADLYENPKGHTPVEVENLIRGQIRKRTEQRPYWLEPVFAGRTPMKSAFELAETLLDGWLADHRGLDCYPPTVINITDGAATDAKDDELITIATRIKQRGTIDGHVLFLNVHLSGAAGNSVLFPAKVDELPHNTHARLLYDLSSEMPANYHMAIANIRREDRAHKYIGMSFNANVADLVRFMDIGTPTTVTGALGSHIQPEP